MHEQVADRRRYKLFVGGQPGGFRARMMPSRQAPAVYKILPRRAGAMLIDWIVWLVAAEVLAFVLGQSQSFGYLVTADGTEQYLGGALYALSPAQAYLLMCVWLCYLVVAEFTLGATLGKLVLGVRVVRSNGARVGFRAVALRQVPRSVMLSVIFLFTGVAVEPFYFILEASLAWTHDRRQRIGDRIADTVVVRRGDVPELPMATKVSQLGIPAGTA